MIIREGELFILDHDGSPVTGHSLRPIRIPGPLPEPEVPGGDPVAAAPSDVHAGGLHALDPTLRQGRGSASDPSASFAAARSRSKRSTRAANPITSERRAGDRQHGRRQREWTSHRGGLRRGWLRRGWNCELDRLRRVRLAVHRRPSAPLNARGSGYDGWCRTTTARVVPRGRACSISRVTGRRRSSTPTKPRFVYFRGSDGVILYEDDYPREQHPSSRCRSSSTSTTTGNPKWSFRSPTPTSAYGGIEIWEDQDNNWVRNSPHLEPARVQRDQCHRGRSDPARTRRPIGPSRRLNNFRQNVQPGGLFDAPDFFVREIRRLGCDDTQYTFSIVVGNDGSLSVPAGIRHLGPA